MSPILEKLFRTKQLHLSTLREASICDPLLRERKHLYSTSSALNNFIVFSPHTYIYVCMYMYVRMYVYDSVFF